MVLTLAQSRTAVPGAAPESRQKRDPIRRCLASGELRSKDELLRFVVDPDGALLFDLDGSLPGRGLWLLPRRDMIDKACARNLFARAAREPVKVPADLADRVAQMLRRRGLDLLGLARRSGQLQTGFEKVRSMLRDRRAALLLQAVDASAAGRDKVSALGRATNPELRVLALFTSAELSQALGRDNVVHVAVEPGTMARRLTLLVARFESVTGIALGRDQDVSA